MQTFPGNFLAYPFTNFLFHVVYKDFLLPAKPGRASFESPPFQGAPGERPTLQLRISKLFQCQRFDTKGKRCADGSNNSHFQGRLPSLLGRQISSEPLVETSQGDAALFPHGRQEEDAVRRLMPPGSDGRTDCWRGTDWNPSLIRGQL